MSLLILRRSPGSECRIQRQTCDLESVQEGNQGEILTGDGMLSTEAQLTCVDANSYSVFVVHMLDDGSQVFPRRTQNVSCSSLT
jgi:hypothetical protein